MAYVVYLWHLRVMFVFWHMYVYSVEDQLQFADLLFILTHMYSNVG